MKNPPAFPPRRRLRRNRRSVAIRHLVQETHITTKDLIQPLFVQEKAAALDAVESMPGIYRLGLEALLRQAETLLGLGIQAVALFPQMDKAYKNEEGSYAIQEDNWMRGIIQKLKQAFPELLVIIDIALDPYTTHGHDGVLDVRTQQVANDPTVEILRKMAVCFGTAGADVVAPSDMMDGRVGAIREALDAEGLTETGILAYSAKFASSYYGPFREAVGSLQAAGTPSLDKQSYQLNPANAREGLLEAQLDEEEGADILMVKPAGLYLDLLCQLRQQTRLPLAAYQVSGEYAQIHAAAQRGWLDLPRARHESLLAIKRAGADMILTYFAEAYAKDLGS